MSNQVRPIRTPVVGQESTCYRLGYLHRMKEHTITWKATLPWEPRSLLQIHFRDNCLASRVPGPGRSEGLLCFPGLYFLNIQPAL